MSGRQRVALLVDGAAAPPPVHVVHLRVARAEDDCVRVDDERHTRFEHDRADQKRSRVAGGFEHHGSAAAASVDRALHALRVELFVRPCSASVVSATGVSSAVSTVHAAGRFGSVTLRASCAPSAGATSRTSDKTPRRLQALLPSACSKRMFQAPLSRRPLCPSVMAPSSPPTI